MGEVIALFRDSEPPTPEVWSFHEHVSEALVDQMVEVASDLDRIHLCPTAEDFADTVRSIKERVGGWPDG